MITTEHNLLDAGTDSVSTMECTSHNNNSIDSTMVSNTEVATESTLHNSDVGDSVGSYDVSSISHGGSGGYTSDAYEEDTNFVPKWKYDGDGDDSICTSIGNIGDDDIEDDIENDDECYKIHRIPSTLEFALPQAEIDGKGGQDEHLCSPSTLSFSHRSSLLVRIEMTKDNFPSLPDVSIPLATRPEEQFSGRDVTADQVVRNTNEQQKSFRRRLHSATDMGSIVTNPLSESQSSSASAPSLYTILKRSRPRFALTIIAMVLVMLSVHEKIKCSRQYYRRQYQLREEIEFPLVQEQIHTDGEGITDERTLDAQQKNSLGDHVQSKADLPKLFFPKNDSSNTNRIRGSASAGHSGSNLVMARSQQSRPIFVSDIPLPDGGFRKPLERFVYDSSQQEQTQGQWHSKRHTANNELPSSWTTWMASLALIAMLVDTGWKEYRRQRIAAIPSWRDE